MSYLDELLEELSHETQRLGLYPPIKWWQDRRGKTSAMRIIAMMCAVTGCVAVIAGVFGMFMSIPESVAIAGVGGGMAGLGEVAKAWQSKGE